MLSHSQNSFSALFLHSTITIEQFATGWTSLFIKSFTRQNLFNMVQNVFSLKRRISKKLISLLTILIISLIFGCSNDLDSMIEDYNQGFYSEDEEVAYTVDNVVADEMLANQYPVPYRTTLCLSAPTGGSVYSWDAVIGENACGIDEDTSYNLGKSRLLVLYIPDSDLKQWAHYELTLTVQKPDGSYLKDTAKLYIY